MIFIGRSAGGRGTASGRHSVSTCRFTARRGVAAISVVVAMFGSFAFGGRPVAGQSTTVQATTLPETSEFRLEHEGMCVEPQ